MSEVKNYGLTGVGSDVQLGKGGSRLKEVSGRIEVKDVTDAAYVNVAGLDPVDSQDFVTKAYFENNAASASNKLEVPDDGTHGGAVNSWSVGATTYSTALDDLNEVLGKLVPPGPPVWPDGDNINSITGSATWQLASGSTDNTGNGLPAAGSNVTTIYSANIVSELIGEAGDSGSGPGDSGTIEALLNGTGVGSTTLDTNNNSGTYSSLQISSNPGYPSSSPDFYQVVQASINGATALAGYNKIQITHSDASNTNEYFFVYDSTLSGQGSVSDLTIVDPGLTTANSSTVPHFIANQSLDVSGTLNNLSGHTYRKTNAVNIGSSDLSGNGNPLTSVNFNIGDTGMPADPIALNTASAGFTNLDAPTANVHASGRATVRFSNPNGGATSTINSPILLVMGSATTSAVDEDNINTSGIPNLLSSGASSGNNAARVDLAGDAAANTPGATFTGTSANWTGATALETFDATVVGGVLKHDQTNYSTGYLPAGPNLSTQSAGTQYVTFMFRANPLSKFDVRLTAPGGVTGVWVKLPGVSDNGSYHDGGATNGWWDMTTAYAGVGVPGLGSSANGSTGCAVAGTVPTNSAINNQRYTCTFGTESAANATNNIILVRIGLASGDTVTALSFTGASN